MHLSGVLTAALTNYTMTASADVAAAASTVAAPGTTDVKDASNNPIAATRAASVGALTVAGVSVDPASASNIIGQAHTITWTLPAGYTCASDADFADTLRSCDATDVSTSGGTATVTSGPTVSDTNLNNQATVTVTIADGGVADTTTVTLATKFQDDDVAFIETPDVSATKTYTTFAGAGGGVTRHVDVDCASERANGSGGADYGSNALQCNGLLSNGDIFNGNLAVSGFALDDSDDATGSLHTVCILGNITSADNANIDWTITPTAGSSATVNNLQKVGLDVSGNSNLEPCVQWRSGGVGGQTITATYIPTGEVIYSNGVQDLASGLCPDDDPAAACEPLIKQWNDIDYTSIINVTGNVGDTLGDNTGELDAWGSRDCTDQRLLRSRQLGRYPR